LNIGIFINFVDMKNVQIQIPDDVEISDKEVTMLIATTFYEKGKLSLGQAANIVGLSKRTFAELLAYYNVSIFNYPSSDITKDVMNA
jgi:predicted HTH domain antitoxin